MSCRARKMNLCRGFYRGARRHSFIYGVKYLNSYNIFLKKGLSGARSSKIGIKKVKSLKSFKKKGGVFASKKALRRTYSACFRPLKATRERNNKSEQGGKGMPDNKLLPGCGACLTRIVLQWPGRRRRRRTRPIESCSRRAIPSHRRLRRWHTTLEPGAPPWFWTTARRC